MANNIKEFVNADGTLINSKVPITDPKTTAKTTTDKSMKMRAQPFMFSTYRRFFSENELPHTQKADELQENPEGFHKFLESIGEGQNFEQYFQKDDAKGKLKEVSRDKAYKMLETLLANKDTRQDVLTKTPPTIEEIQGKETLLVDKLTKVADTIRQVMDEEEKKVILNYFSQRIK